jgi:hypothetical protein
MDINNSTDFGTVKILMLKGEKGDQGEAGDAGDYTGLTNKPSINNVTLTGNKTPSDLGLATEVAVQTAVSDASQALGATAIIGTGTLDTVAQTLIPAINELAKDYIVDEGTDSNGWYVRKWSSGYIEASILISNPTWQNDSTVNGVTRNQLDIPTIPSMVSKLGINATGVNSGSWMATGIDANLNFVAFTYRISGNARPTTVALNIWGMWK